MNHEQTDARRRHESELSCAAATQNLLLAAHALGLGACWQGDPLLAQHELRKTLQLPKEVKVVSSVALGYAASAACPPARPLLREAMLCLAIPFVGF